MTIEFNSVRAGQVGVYNNTQTAQLNFAAIQSAELLALTQQLADPRSPMFARLFGNLPPAPLPRPPQYNSTLANAALKMNEFAQSVGQYGGGQGAFGYQQYLGLAAMNQVVGGYASTQALYAQSSFNLHIGFDATVSSPGVQARSTEDEFGTGLGAGEGHNSNLSNSPEVVLALNNILKNSPDNTGVEDVQKKLKEEYGIEAKIEDINGRKALKFANGDTFVDSSGNGMLGQADYKFGGAVDAIKKKYGLSDEDMKQFESEDGKKMLGQMSAAREQLSMPQSFNYGFSMDVGMQNSFVGAQNSYFGMQSNFLSMNTFAPFFAQAYAFAF